VIATSLPHATVQGSPCTGGDVRCCATTRPKTSPPCSVTTHAG